MKKIAIRRILAVCLLVFLITLAVVSLTKEIIVRNWVEDAFQKHLNLKVKIQNIYIDIFQPRLTLEDLHILNPPNFGRHWFANIPSVVLDYSIGSFFMRTVNAKQLKLDILEVNIVKDAEGEINLNTINHFGSKSGHPFDLFIENLDLSIRRVTFQDMTMSVPVKVYDLNLKNMKFKDIKTLEGLSQLIAAKIFERIGVSQIGISREDLEELPRSSNPILRAGSFVRETVQTVKDIIPGDFT